MLAMCVAEEECGGGASRGLDQPGLFRHRSLSESRAASLESSEVREREAVVAERGEKKLSGEGEEEAGRGHGAGAGTGAQSNGAGTLC
mmetsp:Transcript_22722/g.69461  ORF Transcript_22722/g.69461 Transcript_22722/m.69461 type:complete len:88 (-) Transcript_22722:86-349(-)